MTICILGRQPEIGLAELEALYGAEHVKAVGTTCALVDVPVDFSRLGGTVKTAELLASTSGTLLRPALTKITKLLPTLAAGLPEGKIKLGLSLYDFDIRPYDINGESLRLKKILRRDNHSVRVIPNETPALSSAQTYHNSLASELGLEFVVAHDESHTYIARVTHVQNIDEYRIRDRERPKRDAFVGMLPPKLAQVIVNLAVGEVKGRRMKEEGRESDKEPHDKDKRVAQDGVAPTETKSIDFGEDGANSATGPASSDLRGNPEGISNDGSGHTSLTILDPFCGTGVIPQEALLMGYDVYGTDKSAKMIDYTAINLKWLQEGRKRADSREPTAESELREEGSDKAKKKSPATGKVRLEVADATDHIWLQPISTIACEGYLGQPLGGQSPTTEKLHEIIHDSNGIMRDFLKNVAPQLATDARLCVAMPAWFVSGVTHHLPVIDELEELGFTPVTFAHAPDGLVYRREDQVVGRELVVLKRR